MWGAIIGAGISAASSLFASHQANNAAKELAGSAVQTRVKDMRAAGLNPVLAAGQTGAAQVPQQQTPDFSSAAGVFRDLTARKAQKNQAFNQTRATDSTIALQNIQGASTAADVRVKDAQTKNLLSQNNLINQQALTEAARRSNLEANTGLASANQVRTQYQTMQDKVISDYLMTPAGRDSAEVRYNAGAGGIPGIANTVVGAARSAWDNVNNPGSSSAKQVHKNQVKLPLRVPRNPYQKPVRFAYPQR